MSSSRPLQRCRKSISPQNSSIREIALLATSAISGSPVGNEEKHQQRRQRLASNWKSIVCLLFIITFVLGYFLVFGAPMFRVGGNFYHQEDTSDCSIQEWHYPNCQPFLSGTDASSSSLTPRDWYNLRQAYEDAVGVAFSTLDPSWKENPDVSITGFRVPIETRVSSGKGRGIYLTQPVSKGQILWDNRFLGRFPTECSARIFFASVGAETACNVIMWGYVNDFFGQGLQFQLDLDDSTFFNEPSNSEQANVLLGLRDKHSSLEQRRQPGAYHLYAKQDLKAGTELLFDYSEVHAYASLYWYEMLCLGTRGLWGWLTMQ